MNGIRSTICSRRRNWRAELRKAPVEAPGDGAPQPAPYGARLAGRCTSGQPAPYGARLAGPCTSGVVWLVACILLLGFVAPLFAQNEKRDYVDFGIDPDFKKVLENRLKMEKDLGPFKELIKKFANDPKAFPLKEEDLKNLNLKDEKLQDALKDWAKNNPELKRAFRDWMKDNPPGKEQPAKMEELRKQLQKIVDEKKPDVGRPPDIKPVEVPVARPGDPPKANVDPVAKATERAMKQAENTKFGDWLRESPAWRKAARDLQASMSSPDAARLNPGDWKNRLRLPEGQVWKLGEGAFERFQGMPRPNLGGFRPALPGVGNIAMPRLAAPAMPDVSGPALPTIGVGVMWLLLLLLFLLIAWQLLRWNKRSLAAGVDRQAQLGPWPVRPEEVSTRAELVAAFDYLALLKLGRDAQCWNHHAVARRWSEDAPPCAESAEALATLYEEARYTEGADELTEPQRDLARRSLLQLTEAL